MIVRPIKTSKIRYGNSIFEVLDRYLKDIENQTIVAITSKIVAICEGRVVNPKTVDKEELIAKESQYYIPKTKDSLGHRTIVQHTLGSGAGIDESNTDGKYVLLPSKPQQSANEIRKYLSNKFNLSKIGVVITDSTSRPLRLGASGIALGWSGFAPIKDYRGEKDIFGRPYKVSHADIAGGLAAAATLAMGEGAEQTPIALITEVPFVDFQNRNPSKEEQEYMNFPIDDDLFAPLLKNAGWQKGGR
jgi:coenzyme F420-0:L-glutamate ligase